MSLTSPGPGVDDNYYGYYDYADKVTQVTFHSMFSPNKPKTTFRTDHSTLTETLHKIHLVCSLSQTQ